MYSPTISSTLAANAGSLERLKNRTAPDQYESYVCVCALGSVDIYRVTKTVATRLMAAAKLAGKTRRYPLPLIVMQYHPIQGHLPFGSLESNFSDDGNLLLRLNVNRS